MNALNTLERIINNENLVFANLKYCLVNKDKIPYKINGDNARSNYMEDFVDIEELIDKEDITSHEAFWDINNIANMCTIAQIDVDGSNIAIAKSSKLNR